MGDAEALLATHGIPVAVSCRCRDLERAPAVAQEIGGPLALKADVAAPARAGEIDAVLRERILRFSLLLAEVPEVLEADLNPVRCTTNGCVVLDMRLRIEPWRPARRVTT